MSKTSDLELLDRIERGGDITPEDTGSSGNSEALMNVPNGYKDKI